MIEISDEILLRHRLQLAPIHRAIAIARHAQHPGNREAGGFVVARHHHGPDACGTTLGDGDLHLLAWRVHLADETEENGTPGELIEARVFVDFRFIHHRDSEQSQGLQRHLLACVQNLTARVVIERKHFIAMTCVAAERQQHLRRAFDENAIGPVRVTVLRGHELGGGVEGNLRAARPLVAKLGWFNAALQSHGEQRGLRGITQRAPARFFGSRRHKLRVVAQRTCFENEAQCGVTRWREVTSVAQQRAFRRVARTGDFNLATLRQTQGGDRHLVLGQRAGLVRTDDVRGAKRLHCREPANDRSFRRHALHPHGQRNRQRHGQTLRHQRDHLTNGHHQNIHDGHAAQQSHSDHERHHHDGCHHELAAELIHAHFERCLGFHGSRGHACDLAHLGGLSRCHHERLAPPGGDVRAGEHHVQPVCEQRVIGQRFDVLGDWQGFTREGRLGRFERGGFEQARIRPDSISGGEEHDITGHEFARGDQLLLASAQHSHMQGGQLAQRRHRAFRAAFLNGADDRIDQHHDENYQRVLMLAEHGGENSGCEENINQRAGELPQEHPPQRFPLFLGQRVCSMLRDTADRLIL